MIGSSLVAKGILDRPPVRAGLEQIGADGCRVIGRKGTPSRGDRSGMAAAVASISSNDPCARRPWKRGARLRRASPARSSVGDQAFCRSALSPCTPAATGTQTTCKSLPTGLAMIWSAGRSAATPRHGSPAGFGELAAGVTSAARRPSEAISPPRGGLLPVRRRSQLAGVRRSSARAAAARLSSARTSDRRSEGSSSRPAAKRKGRELISDKIFERYSSDGSAAVRDRFPASAGGCCGQRSATGPARLGLHFPRAAARKPGGCRAPVRRLSGDLCSLRALCRITRCPSPGRCFSPDQIVHLPGARRAGRRASSPVIPRRREADDALTRWPPSSSCARAA